MHFQQLFVNYSQKPKTKISITRHSSYDQIFKLPLKIINSLFVPMFPVILKLS